MCLHTHIHIYIKINHINIFVSKINNKNNSLTSSLGSMSGGSKSKSADGLRPGDKVIYDGLRPGEVSSRTP